jgi:hypothetical protein
MVKDRALTKINSVGSFRMTPGRGGLTPGRGADVCSRVQGTIPGWLNPACSSALNYVHRAGGTSDIANHPGRESGNRTHS